MKRFLVLFFIVLLAPMVPSLAAERKPFVESIPAWVNSESGAKVVQITSQPVTSNNVHMEQRFTSADGRRVAIERQSFGHPPELWICDLDTTRLYRIGKGQAMTASFSQNAIYYLTPSPESRLMRINLLDLSTREIMAIPDDRQPRKLAVSNDESRIVAGPFWLRDNVYQIGVIDLANGKRTTLCELADIPNPHLQFDPGNPEQLLVQVNRGSEFTPTTGLTRLSGSRGATLCMIGVPSVVTHGPRLEIQSDQITPAKYRLYPLGKIDLTTDDSLIWFGRSWATNLEIGSQLYFPGEANHWKAWVSLKFTGAGYGGAGADQVLCDRVILVRTSPGSNQ